MIVRLPISAFQNKLIAMLREKQTTPVYDSVPPNAAPPFITTGDCMTEPAGTKDLDITDVTFELNVWSKYPGHKEINEICEDVLTAYTSWPLDLRPEGFRVLSQDYKTAASLAMEDGTIVGKVTLAAKIQNTGGN